MPVIINEFEVVSEAATPQSAPSSDAAAESKPKLDAGQLEAPLNTLHQEALRVWTH